MVYFTWKFSGRRFAGTKVDNILLTFSKRKFDDVRIFGSCTLNIFIAVLNVFTHLTRFIDLLMLIIVMNDSFSIQTRYQPIGFFKQIHESHSQSIFFMIHSIYRYTKRTFITLKQRNKLCLNGLKHLFKRVPFFLFIFPT